jgi:hypothetical protein
MVTVGQNRMDDYNAGLLTELKTLMIPNISSMIPMIIKIVAYFLRRFYTLIVCSMACASLAANNHTAFRISPDGIVKVKRYLAISQMSGNIGKIISKTLTFKHGQSNI